MKIKRPTPSEAGLLMIVGFAAYFFGLHFSQTLPSATAFTQQGCSHVLPAAFALSQQDCLASSAYVAVDATSAKTPARMSLVMFIGREN